MNTGNCYRGAVTYEIGIHINVESKAPWDESPEGREQRDAFPPDMLSRLQAVMHRE